MRSGGEMGTEWESGALGERCNWVEVPGPDSPAGGLNIPPPCNR